MLVFKRLYSRSWFLLDRFRQRLVMHKRKRNFAIAALALLVFSTMSAFGIPVLNQVLVTSVTGEDVSAFLLALGAALIGGAAIAFTLIMFAMQVNVERLPHGLFRRFSTDRQLLVGFLAIFVIAIGVTLCSLVASLISPGSAIVGALWACVILAYLLWFVYRRALLLISPWSQLELMVISTKRALQRSVRRARMLQPLLESKKTENIEQPFPLQGDVEPDVARNTIFHLDPRWDTEAYRAVSFAISFAARSSELGDYETSNAALGTIVKVNACYVRAKGRTFIGSNELSFLTGFPGGCDGFISETLEQLRQYMQVAVGRQDERQVEQVLNTFGALTQVYLSIEYAVSGNSKRYAALSAGYLTASVKTTPSLKSPDVLMHAIKKMSSVTQLLVVNGLKSHASTTSEELCKISLNCIIEPQLRMVVSTVMEAYADVLISLIVSDEHTVRNEVNRLQECVSQVAEMLLKIPETTVLGEHSVWAQAFYSMGHTSSLSAKMSAITNRISTADAEDKVAHQAVRHLQEWADKLWEHHRELLQHSVKKRSKLTFDLVHWISGMSQMLIAIADAPVSNRMSDDLRRSASWLALTLSFIPNDKDTIDFIESSNLTEQFFEIAKFALQHNSPEIADQIREVMLSRACTKECEDAGWDVLSNTIRGLCVLAIIDSKADAVPDLIDKLQKHLLAASAPSQEYQERVAKTIFEYDHGISQMSYAMGQVDRPLLQEALKSCAVVLRDPDTTSAEPLA